MSSNLTSPLQDLRWSRTAALMRRALRGRTGETARLLLVAGACGAVNVAVGAAMGSGETRIGLGLALVVLLVAAANVVIERRDVLLFAAVALSFAGIPQLTQRLPGTGGTAIFVPDVLVVLAVAGHVVARLTGRRPRTGASLRTIVLSWPLALFAVALAVGIIRGHERYGTSYLAQPVRLVVYAAIAAAMGGLSARRAFQGLTKVFYVGAVVQGLYAAYHLATGTSQTTSVDLSTGGSRFVALSTAMYMAGTLVLVVLNLDLLERGARRWPHLAVGGLSFAVVVLAFGRTTFVALALVLPMLLMASGRARRTLLSYAPLLAPCLALGVAAAAIAFPSLGTTITQRLTFDQVARGRDTAVITRQRKYHAVLEGIGEHPFFGFGFGRPVEYQNIDNSIGQIDGDPENTYVYVLAGGGGVALGAMIVLIVAFFADAFRRALRSAGVERALVLFAMALAAIFLVNTLTGPVLTQPELVLTTWIALLLPALVTPGSAPVRADEGR
jgi:hypothetical protein